MCNDCAKSIDLEVSLLDEYQHVECHVCELKRMDLSQGKCHHCDLILTEAEHLDVLYTCGVLPIFSDRFGEQSPDEQLRTMDDFYVCCYAYRENEDEGSEFCPHCSEQTRKRSFHTILVDYADPITDLITADEVYYEPRYDPNVMSYSYDLLACISCSLYASTTCPSFIQWVKQYDELQTENPRKTVGLIQRCNSYANEASLGRVPLIGDQFDDDFDEDEFDDEDFDLIGSLLTGNHDSYYDESIEDF
jgi:hypothetical protein